MRGNVRFFNELKASLEEAVEIKNGVRVPGCVARYAVADVKTIRKPMPPERPAGKERQRHR